MYNNRRNFEVNVEQTAAFLENALNNVESDLDVDSLSELAKLFKKCVPFSRRKYVTAYLLREALKHDHSFRGNRFERNDRNDKRNKKNDVQESAKKAKPVPAEKEAAVQASQGQSEERQPHPRVEIPEDQATNIFISIGRNRRVFPRDLVSLLINVGNLDRERIGNIKILANYSFVQLYTEDAEKAIAALNEFEYRGRRLAVNFSRPKNENEVPSDEVSGNMDDNMEEQMSAEDAAALAAAEKAATNEPFGNGN